MISGCRGGLLKVWNSENCKLISEIKAHSTSINSIDSNSNFVFTGSNDNSIGFWVARNTWNDQSPEFSEQLLN